MAEVVAQSWRGPMVENVYRGDAAVVDSTGRLLFVVGSAEKKTYWRSSAKPVQIMPLVYSGAADAFGLEPRHLAIVCASHNGESVHTQTVQEVLHKAGLTTDFLQCGPHMPYDAQTAAAMTAAGEAPGHAHNNCSGKHSGMLALGKHLGLPLHDYMNPASELQQLILANVADVTGVPPEQIAIGVDGCGVPVFGLPLLNMAWSFARLAGPEAMPSGKEEAGRRLRDAMLAHPYNVAGRNRICTDIMSLPGRRFVAKSGAEGVYCLGILPEAAAKSPLLQSAGAVGGVGIAVKAEDGNKDVRHLMLVEILDQLGLLTPADLEALARFRAAPVKNWAGTVVGELKPIFTLHTALATVSVRPPSSQADREWLAELWRREWGGETMVTRGRTHHLAEMEALIAWSADRRVGAATFVVENGECELMSLNALQSGNGVGSRLLEAAEEASRTAGCRRLWLITSNDNLEALRFYQRRGYRLAALYPGAVDDARRVKPSIPLVGEHGIPIHDDIELEKNLS